MNLIKTDIAILLESLFEQKNWTEPTPEFHWPIWKVLKYKTEDACIKSLNHKFKKFVLNA